MSEEAGLITVYVANGQPEAQIVKGRLETEGKQVERVVMLDTRLPKAHAEDVARELMRALS